jgi:hypothetical protein
MSGWKVERLFARLQNFRRIVVRYERVAENFLGMLHLVCSLISLAGFMRWLLITPLESIAGERIVRIAVQPTI